MVHEVSSSRDFLINFLIKLAIYLLSFGFVLLLTVGIKTMGFSLNDADKTLAILGFVMVLLGVLYIIVVVIIAPVAIVTPANMPDRDSEMASTISGSFDFGRYSSNYQFANPAFRAAEQWESPPCYESATASNVRILNTQPGHLTGINHVSPDI